jgi:hypothetical protein
MLTPGEFVIKKSSVGKIGAGTLAQMNENRFNDGGIIALRPFDQKEDGPNPTLQASGRVTLSQVASKTQLSAFKGSKGAQKFREQATRAATGRVISPELRKLLTARACIFLNATGLTIGDETVGTKTENLIKKKFASLVNTSGAAVARFFGATPSKEITPADTEKFGITSVIGNALEAILVRLGAPFDEGQDNNQRARVKGNNNSAFDFPGGIGPNLGKGRFSILTNIPVDAKRTLSQKNLNEVITKKFPNLLAEEFKSLKLLQGQEQKAAAQAGAASKLANAKRGDIFNPQDLGTSFTKAGEKFPQLGDRRQFEVITQRSKKVFRKLNTGGGISGQDTVPAMLTPGEFVINKKAAQSIGSANLNTMNKKGVVGFNKGGMVGFEAGGRVTQGRHFYGLGHPGTGFGMSTPKPTGPSEDPTDKATNRLLALSLAVGTLSTVADQSRKRLGEFGNVLGDSIDGLLKVATTAVAIQALLSTLQKDSKLKSLGTAIGGAFVAFQALSAITDVVVNKFKRAAEAAIEKGDADEAAAQSDEAAKFGLLGSVLTGVGTGAVGGGLLGAKIGGGIGTFIGGPAGTAGGALLGGIGGALVGGIGGGIVGYMSAPENDREQSASSAIIRKLPELDKNFESFSKGQRTAALTIQQTNAALAKARSDAQKYIKDETLAAKTEAEITKQELRLATEVIGPTAKNMAELRKQTANMTKANKEAAIAAFKVAAAQRELIKINLDAARIGGAAARAGTAAENVVARFQPGSSSLEADFKTLETSTTTFGTSDDGKAALDRIEGDINSRLDRIGVKGSARDVINRSAASSGAAVEFSARLSEKIAGAQLTRGQDKKGKIEEIVTTITGEIENKFKGTAGANLTKTINGSLESVIKQATSVDGTIDESKVVEGLAKAANAAGKPLRMLGEAFIKHEKLINKLTAQRRIQEQKLISAQSKAIDLQLEGAKVIEQAGGRRLSFQDKLGARGNQANLRLRDAGVGGLGGTGTGNIIGASRRLVDRNAQLNQKVNSGGRLSVDEARGPAILKANNALIEFTRQRIKLIQEEMNIIKQKNALERSAIDALLSGNAEEFFEKQSASAAASALKSGNTALIRSLDASAVGAGLKSLQDQGTSSTELFSAARTAGLSQQQARIFSGTTPEENSLRRELMASGRTLGALGNTGSELEASNLGVAIQIINQANNAFAETLKKELNSANDTQNQVTERNIKATDNLTEQLKDTSKQLSILSDAIEGSPNEITSTINVNSASSGPSDNLLSYLPGVLAESLKRLIPNLTHDNNGNHQINTPNDVFLH